MVLLPLPSEFLVLATKNIFLKDINICFIKICFLLSMIIILSYVTEIYNKHIY